jgi:hypothetical protein
MINYYGMGPLTPNTIVCGGTSQEENLIQYLDVIKTAHQMGRNVVVINDEQSAAMENEKKVVGDIHVWWDDHSQDNTKLMLILAYMLRKNPAWKQTKMCLIGIAANEQEKQEKLKELNKVVKLNRLKIETQVLVSAHGGQDLLELVQFFSAKSAMVFLGAQPPKPEEPLEEYAHYFRKLPHKSAQFPPVALVMCAEHTDLQEVLHIHTPTE